MPRPRRPTQSDIAKLAGVSRGTVSVVLNDQRHGPIQVSEETRQRILEAARKVGYVPNPAAQMLARGSNRLIALFSYSSTFPVERENPFYANLVGIQRGAVHEDYNLLLITRGQRSKLSGIHASAADMLRLADGALIIGARPDREELRRLAQEGYPFVCIGRREVPGCQIDWVSSDYVDAGVQATRHLLQLGHRRLALVCTGPTSEEIEDRIEGCRRAVAEAPDAELAVIPEEALGSAEALGAALREAQSTALMCGGMASLRLATKLLQELAIRVPDDLSVASLAFDEGRLWPFHALHPTYVRHQEDVVGELAVHLLARRLSGAVGPAQHERVPVTLVVGNSTAPLAR